MQETIILAEVETNTAQTENDYLIPAISTGTETFVLVLTGSPRAQFKAQWRNTEPRA